MEKASTITNNHRSELEAVIQSTTNLARAEALPSELRGIGLGPAVILPEGKVLVELDNLRRNEEHWATRRVRGVAKLTRPASFVDHVLRFEVAGETALFASPQSITAVFNYHYAKGLGDGEGERAHVYAQHADHRAQYAWPLSEAWKVWSQAWDGRRLSSVDLATLLEDRIVDVLDPASPSVFESTRETVRLLGLTLGTASDLMAVAKDFRVSVKREVAAAHNLDTGEVQIEYSEVHEGARAPKRAVNVPTGFILALPVHEDGSAFQVVVRLRYVLDGPKVLWQLKAHAVDEVVRVAVEHQVQSISEQLPTVPLFWGAPEA